MSPPVARRSYLQIAGCALLIACLALLVFGAAEAFAAPGDLDPTFSGDGYADLATVGATDLLYSGHRQVVVAVSDGKLTLTGIDRHGNLDQHFGTGGLVTMDFPAPANGASGAVDTRGRLLIVVRTLGGSNLNFLLRFHRNGQLDSGFGNGGAIQVTGSILDAVASGPDGSIVTVGNADYAKQPQSGTYGPYLWAGVRAVDRRWSS
jgi:hypothetical protein